MNTINKETQMDNELKEVNIDRDVHSFNNQPDTKQHDYITLEMALDEESNEVNPEGRFARNRDLIPQDLLNGLSIIGCGGIGSALAIQTAIMGWEHVEFWDDDKLEIHNLSTTTYPGSYVGECKAQAAHDMQLTFGSQVQYNTANAHIVKAEKTALLCKNVIVCTDNMKSREDVYHAWRGHKSRNIFVDIRMGALSINVATVTKDNDDYLNKDWYNDSDVIDEPCTQKHTIFTAQIAAGMGMKQMFLALKGVPYYSYITHNLSVEKHIVDQDRLIL